MEKRKIKTKFTVRDAANLVRELEDSSDSYYVALETKIPLSKVLQVREALRIKQPEMNKTSIYKLKDYGTKTII